MTTHDNNKPGKLVKLAVEIDEQLKNKSNTTQPEQLEFLPKNADNLSEADVEELSQASEALKFLDQIREDLGTLSTTASDANTNQRIPNSSPTFEQIALDSMLDEGGDTIGDKNQKFGRFRIIEAVGEGGFARVFRAHDPLLDREIALKIPRPQALTSEESRARFVREGKAAAMLSHPAIVAVFEAGEIGTINFIASEYCAGETLAAWFDRLPGQADIRDLAAIVKRIAEAAHHAHQRGVIHRDLKPSNILIEDGEGDLADRIRVTDFGLAKHLSNNEDVTLTMEGAVVGTPAYMSPEQVRCDPDVGVATDIYSMGVILYELVTGTPPHKKSGITPTIHAVQFDPIYSIAKFRTGVPKEFDAICQKCLEKNPSSRYSSAFDLAADLECYLNGMPISARRHGRSDRVIKWAKRNPIIATCLAITLLALTAGGITSWLLYRQAEHDRVVAVEANVQKTDALELAQTRLTEMHKQMDLLTSVFDEIKSDDQGGVNGDRFKESLRENLVLAADRVFESTSDPSLRSNMAARLGISLGKLGYGQQSEEVTRKALELGLENQLPRAEMLVLELYAAIGMANAGKLSLVIDSMQPIVDAVLESSLIKNRDKFIALGTLAHSYHNSNQPQQAATTYQRIIDYYDLLKSNELANSPEHKKVSEPTLRTGQNFLDSRDAIRRYATAFFQVAVNECRQDMSEANIEQLLRSRDRVEKELGSSDWGTIGVSYSAADLLHRKGRVNDALALAEAALDNSVASFGQSGYQTIIVVNTLIVICASHPENPACSSRLPDVLAIGKNACADYLEKVNFHPNVVRIYQNVARGYEISGDYDQCTGVLRRLVAIARENQCDTRTVQEHVFALGMTLAKNDQHDDAVEFLTEFVDVAEKHPEPDSDKIEAAIEMLESIANLR